MLLMGCNNSGDNKAGPDSTNKKETPKSETIAPPMDSATKMKNWQAYMTPGDMHKMMATWDGTWNSEISLWEKPGAPPQKSTGTAVNKMVLGGRYQETVNTGNMMGMPFEGHGTLGYDNTRKVFEETWIDNMGTGIMKMSGPWDAATKSVMLTGKAIDPMSGKEIDYKQSFSVVDNDTQLLTMYGNTPEGKEFKMMEIKYMRKK
jgi:hypothetical protein